MPTAEDSAQAHSEDVAQASALATAAPRGREQRAGSAPLPLSLHWVQEKVNTQLELARAVARWLSRAVSVPRKAAAATQCVHAPLFAPPHEALEDTLLYGERGTWSERVALLFVALAKACHLEAVAVSGYWRSIALPPGAALAVHNHCWNAVKVQGRWRLLDISQAALERGHVAFFSSPEHYAVTHLPLNAPWLLMRNYLAQAAFFQQPWVCGSFLNAGGRLLNRGLCAVTQLPPPMEGTVLPAQQLTVAVPPGYTCAVHLRWARTGCAPSCLPALRFDQPQRCVHAACRVTQRLLTPAGEQLLPSAPPEWRRAADARTAATTRGAPLFQHVHASSHGGHTPVATPIGELACTAHTLAVALPRPGTYLHEVILHRAVPNAMAVELRGGACEPLALTLTESQVAIRVQVCVWTPRARPRSAQTFRPGRFRAFWFDSGNVVCARRHSAFLLHTR